MKNNLSVNTCDLEKTISNLSTWDEIILEKDITPLTMKKDFFQKWDKLIIEEIIENWNENWTITIKFIQLREKDKKWKKMSELFMSWWVFLSYFLNSIDKEKIKMLDLTDKTKKEVKTIIEENKVSKKEKKKWFDILQIFNKKHKK